jgi:hypothetical protein
MIQALMFERELRPVGLRLLQIIGEEFVSNKTDLSSSRRQELKQAFLGHAPAIMASMKQLLDEAYEKPASNPASARPTLEPYDSFADLRPEYVRIPPLSAGSSFALNTPPRGYFDRETLEVCKLTLEILLQFFSWVPLNANTINLPLLNSILKYTQLCDAATVELGQTAMSCINELLCRNFAPQGFQEYLALIFRHVFEILKHLTDGDDALMIDDLDEDYRIRFTEFVASFIQMHIHRFENDAGFPMGAFLELLYKFTYHQPSIEALQNCLVIWTSFFDYLKLSKEKGSHISDKYVIRQIKSFIPYMSRYKMGLLAFNEELGKKMQFCTNASELSGIEDEIENSMGQTDLDLLLVEWLDMLATLAELFPQEIVGFLVRSHLFMSLL